MQPSDSFWDGVGEGISASPWWAIVGSVFVIGVLFLVGKFIVPSLERYRMKKVESEERIKMRELDIREREAQNKSDDIKVKAGMTEQMSGLRESNTNLATQTAAMTARLNESAARSHEMGATVSHIDRTTTRTAAQVDDIHRLLTGGVESTD